MAIRLNDIHDMASDILACVCQVMTEAQAQDPSYPGCPCRNYVSPGNLPAWDACGTGCMDNCGGQLTVNLWDVSESTQFPSTGGSRSAPKLAPGCVPPTFTVAEYLVTVLRCVPVLDEQGTPPTNAELNASARVTMADSAVLLDAMNCCMQGLGAPGKRLKYQVGRQRVLATEGGCSGVEARVSVYFPGCGCPDEGSIPAPLVPA